MEEKIAFEQPLIINLIEEGMNTQDYIEGMIAYPDSYWNKDGVLIVKWMNIRLKCILHNLIRLSYKAKILPSTLSALSEAMMQLVNPATYKLLPENYPYKLFIKELAEKLNEIAEQAVNYDKLRFPLSLKRKAEFIVILYILSNITPLGKFNELTFIYE